MLRLEGVGGHQPSQSNGFFLEREGARHMQRKRGARQRKLDRARSLTRAKQAYRGTSAAGTQ